MPDHVRLHLWTAIGPTANVIKCPWRYVQGSRASGSHIRDGNASRTSMSVRVSSSIDDPLFARVGRESIP